MSKLKHCALLATNLSAKSPIIQTFLKGEAPDAFSHLKGKRGAFLSLLTIQHFINEEVRHDDFRLTKDLHRSLLTLSSGEKKRKLFTYLLSTKPEFLVLDHPFDSIDVEGQNQLKNQLIELATKIPIIQLYSREHELLPFITTIVKMEADNLVAEESISDHQNNRKNKPKTVFNQPIPQPINAYPPIDSLVEFKNVNVHYQSRPILQNINWHIQKGEFWQLIGPNGSGKTTLLTMITGDNPKAFGQDITIFGRKKGSGESVWSIKDKIGYYTASMMDLFSGSHTVQHMVISGLNDSIGLYQRATDLQKGLADEWLMLINLIHLKNAPFLSLPPAQQRLVLMARAMIKHPPLLILDEPSTGLDDDGAELLNTLINKVALESNTAILYVSHHQEKTLLPQFTFKLITGDEGSKGIISTHIV